MKKRQINIIVILVLIVMLVILAMVFFGPKEDNAKRPSTDKLKYVKVLAVNNDTIGIRVAAYGRVTSSRNVNLTAEVQGKLEEGSVPLKTGQQFSKGNFLFRVNDAEQRLSLQSRKSQFLNLMASVLPDLRIDYKDNFKRWESFFNELDVKESIPELPQTTSVNEKTFLASRNVLSEYYGIKADEERLKKYRVYAPFNGIYTDVMVEVGTVVNAGLQVARIIAYNSLEVKVSVNMREIKLIDLGAVADVYAEGKEQKWTGKVVRVGRNVNQSTQSVDVFIQVETGEDQTLYEGMFVETSIHCGEVANASEISRKAVFNMNRVYVVQDSILVSRKLNVAKTNEETVVVEGLEDGELLVTDPIIGVKENAKVIPVKK